jgi:hypothetical protein
VEKTDWYPDFSNRQTSSRPQNRLILLAGEKLLSNMKTQFSYYNELSNLLY